MKTTTSIFTKIALGLLITGSMAACNNNKATGTGATTPPSADKDPIVYINSDSLLNKYDYAKDIKKQLEDKNTAAQSDLQSKGQAFQREVADYKKDMATLPADQRQRTEERLGREQQDLQTYQQRASADVQTEQATQNGKLYDKIADFAKTYAKEKGYKLVLTYSKANPTVLFGDPSLDVTNDVIKRLNDAYAKDKK